MNSRQPPERWEGAKSVRQHLKDERDYQSNPRLFHMPKRRFFV
jgi:hypothetical protein